MSSIITTLWLAADLLVSGACNIRPIPGTPAELHATAVRCLDDSSSAFYGSMPLNWTPNKGSPIYAGGTLRFKFRAVGYNGGSLHLLFSAKCCSYKGLRRCLAAHPYSAEQRAAADLVTAGNIFDSDVTAPVHPAGDCSVQGTLLWRAIVDTTRTTSLYSWVFVTTAEWGNP